MILEEQKRWEKQLFSEYPSPIPKLRENVFFWVRAWRDGDTGPWREFGPTSLSFLENLLIGVASVAFPETLLNSQGVNR